MKILLVNQFFWPDAAPTSQLLTDLARHLAFQGHEVHAIAANGGYSDDEGDNPPPVQIHRPPAFRFGRGKFGRVASYTSFLFTAALKGLFLKRPDIVITLTTPPLLSLLGTMIKACRGSAHFIWEMDVYPDIAIDLNVLRAGGMVARTTGALADLSRRSADGVIALGECMRERLLRHGIPAQKIFVADNWADGTLIEPARPVSEHDKPLAVLYSGNLGLAHDVDTVLGAMTCLNKTHKINFIFAGSGARRADLEQQCRNLQLANVTFRQYASRQKLRDSLCDGDIGLVTQMTASLGSVVPSKIYGLMAAGRPVLFIGPKESTPARIIARFNCGWQIDCGDSDSLAKLLAHLAEDRKSLMQAGLRARLAFDEYYDLPHGVSRICSIIGVSGLHINPKTAGISTLADTQPTCRVGIAPL